MQHNRLRIGEVAQRAGVNVQTLRYYERRGLLIAPARTASGYRAYRPDAVRLIRFVKRAQDLGFTLREIAELLALRNAKGRKRSDVRALAEGRIRDIDTKVRRLQAMRSALDTLVASCACRDGKPVCPILEALEDPEDSSTAPDGAALPGV